MKKEDIEPGNWYRILFGETPVEFMVEILIRTFIMYVVLLVIVRLMGKRMGGQLTISELAVMITLGAIVSPGMQMPQTGLLLCVVILVCALLFQRGLNFLEFKSKKFEDLSQGKLSTLVRNGIMQLDEMKQTNISRQQLFSVLRNKNVFNLGEVDRVYLESCGLFSIYKKSSPAPGLQLFPPGDEHIGLFGQEPISGQTVCASCGKVTHIAEPQPKCPVCYSEHWQTAALTSSTPSSQS